MTHHHDTPESQPALFEMEDAPERSTPPTRRPLRVPIRQPQSPPPERVSQAQADLGGLAPEGPLDIDQERAIVGAGLGTEAMRRRVRQADRDQARWNDQAARAAGTAEFNAGIQHYRDEELARDRAAGMTERAINLKRLRRERNQNRRA